MLTLWWDDATETIQMIDQRALPARLEVFRCLDVAAVAEAIRNMTVRGAPAIGIAAAYGVALAAWHSSATNPADLQSEVIQAADILRATRPTAVNLNWALIRMLRIVDDPGLTVDKLRHRLLAEAKHLAEEDIATNRRMAEFGADMIEDGDTIIHHCNTGALAAVDYGTALGAIRRAYEQGKRLFVLVDETRPRLQGARLTAWELDQYGIPYAIIPDGASGHFLHRGEANKVFFGADRVAANGDVANKIGTYMLSLAAHTNDVPVYAVMPVSTIDPSLPDGSHIPIEERSAEEVLNLTINGEPVAPAGAKARNPAFDVTPHSLITALVTDRGVVYPPFHIHLPRLLKRASSGSL